MSPKKNPRDKYHKGSCTKCHRKHRGCNRDWSVDEPCSQCLKQAKPQKCVRQEVDPQVPGANADGTPYVAAKTGAPPAYTDSSGQHPRPGTSQRSLGHGTKSISSSSIEFAVNNLPDVFDPSRFKTSTGKGHDDHEYSSPMLYCVLILLGHNLSDSKSAAAILFTRAKRAFAEEWLEPTLATIMAIILLSLYLSKHLAQNGNKPNRPSVTPRTVHDLLETAHQRLHSYHEYDHLSGVNDAKINSLLAVVHTAAQSRSLKIRCDDMIPHEPPVAPQMRPEAMPFRSNQPVYFGRAPSDHVPPGTSLPSLSPQMPAPQPPPYQYEFLDLTKIAEAGNAISTSNRVSYPAVPVLEALPSSLPAGTAHKIVPNIANAYSYGTGNTGYNPQHRPIDAVPDMAPTLYGTNMPMAPRFAPQRNAPPTHVPVPSPRAGMSSVSSAKQHGPVMHNVMGQVMQAGGSHSQVQMGSSLGQLPFDWGPYVGPNASFPENGTGTTYPRF